MDYLKTSKLNKEMYFLMSSYFVLFVVCMIFIMPGYELVISWND